MSRLTPKNSLECPHNWPVGPPYSLGWQAGNECTGSDNIWKPTAVLLRQVTGLSGIQDISISVETQALYPAPNTALPLFGLTLQQEGKTNQFLIKTINSAKGEIERIFLPFLQRV